MNKKPVRIVNENGTTLMSIDRMSVKEDDMVITGNLMGCIPGSFYIKPEELWKMVKLVTRELLGAIPVLSCITKSRTGTKTEPVHVADMHGTNMMSVESMSFKIEAIAMSGMISGSIPGSFFIKTGELFKMIRLLTWEIIRAVPRLLRKGRRTYINNLRNPQII
jgi:hypothetical protein